MIATRQEDPNRLAKEDAYALRRILVRRLQQAAKGVSRRERVARHRQFAREWQEMVLEGQLGALRRAVVRGPAQAPGADRPGEGEFLRFLAAGAKPSLPVLERLQAREVAPKRLQGVGGPREEGPVRPARVVAPDRTSGPLQSELFETGLLA